MFKSLSLWHNWVKGLNLYIKLIEEIKTIWPERLKYVESSSNSVDSSLLKSWGHNGERGISIRINKENYSKKIFQNTGTTKGTQCLTYEYVEDNL